MIAIKCTCGNKGCTTKLYVSKSSLYGIDIKITYIDGDKQPSEEIMLDPNAVTQLIAELKAALVDIS